MQYDENGYPVKQHPQQQHHKYGGSPVGAHSLYPQSSATASPPAPNNNQTQSQPIQQMQSPPHQQQQQPFHPTSSPRYDERGYPLKAQHGPPPPLNQPQRQGGIQYDERGYPIKAPQQQQRQFGGDMSLPANQQNMNYALQPYAQQGTYQQQQQQQQPQVAYPPHAQPPFNQNAYNPIQGTQTASGPVLQPYNIQPMAANYWSTGLCDSAADVEICTEGCCCLCCEEARIYDAVVNDQQDSLNCVMCCFGTFLHLATCLSVINLVNRRSFISKYNIQDEDMCMSACFSCLCPCLSSCQVHRELQLRGVYPGGTCCAPSRDPGPRGARVMV